MAAPPATTVSTNYQPATTTKYQTIHIKRFFEIYFRKGRVLKSLFNKVSGLQPAALAKKRLRHSCFPVKLLRIRFFIEHLRMTAS